MGLCYSRKKKRTSTKKNNEAPAAAVDPLKAKVEDETPKEVDPENVIIESLDQKRVLHIEDRASLVGMAVLGPNIYVLSKNPSTISIYKKEEPFEKVDEVILKELNTPWDMVASQKLERLYITDSSTNSIFVMVLPSYEVKPWIGDISYPHTLSITDPDEHVLVVKNGNPSTLELFDHEAQLVSRIELPEKIEYPKHAVRTPTGNFFVSGKTKGEESWRVFEVSAEGKIQRETTESLAECYHLATSDDNTVMVADCWKNRILVFGPELKKLQVLETEFKWPWRVQFVASESLLYVLTGEKPGEKNDVDDTLKSDQEKEEEAEEAEDKDQRKKSVGSVCIFTVKKTTKATKEATNEAKAK